MQAACERIAGSRWFQSAARTRCGKTARASLAITVLIVALGSCLRTDLVVGLPQRDGADALQEDTDAGLRPDESDFTPGESDPETPPGLTLANLRAAWVTPNYIRWQWDLDGDASRFVAFELVVGASAAAVEQRSAAATVVTSSDNPELGFFVLPETEPPCLVTQTASGPLAPGTTLFAQVDVVQDDGRRVQSNIASATTAGDSTQEIILVHDEPPRGYASPPTYVRSTTAPFSGEACYEYTSVCTEGLDCWENLRWQDLSESLAPLPADSVSASAYLEIAVALAASAPSYWSSFALSLEACPSCIYAFEGWTLPADGVYHVYQVPLVALSYGGHALDAATLLASPLYQVLVGGLWYDGATVRVDEAKIRW